MSEKRQKKNITLLYTAVVVSSKYPKDLAVQFVSLDLFLAKISTVIS